MTGLTARMTPSDEEIRKGEKSMAWVTCSCCGNTHQDTPEENVDYYARGQDAGFGQCTECFGEGGAESTFQDIKEAEESGGVDAVEKLMGWANWNFYRSRFGTLKASLNETNSVKFDALPIWKKVSLIQNLITEGRMW